MEQVGILVMLESKPERAEDVATFLASALDLARAEERTIRWYALRMDATRFAIFDTFADEAGRAVHLGGPIARELFAQAEDLFSSPPVVHLANVLAAK